MRLQQVDLATETALAERGAQPTQVAAQDRRDVRVDGDGAGALVLTPLATDVARRRDEDLGRVLAQIRRGSLFVRRIAVAVQKIYRERLVAALADLREQRLERGFAERLDDRAVAAHALVDLVDVAARNQRRRITEVEVVGLRSRTAPHLIDVAEAARREQRAARAFALQERVQMCRRAVHEQLDGSEVLGDLGDCRDDAGVEVRRCRRDLRDLHRPVAGIDRDEIGERPADVYRNPITASSAHTLSLFGYWILDTILMRVNRQSAGSAHGGAKTRGALMSERSPLILSLPVFGPAGGGIRARAIPGRARGSRRHGATSGRKRPGPGDFDHRVHIGIAARARLLGSQGDRRPDAGAQRKRLDRRLEPDLHDTRHRAQRHLLEQQPVDQCVRRRSAAAVQPDALDAALRSRAGRSAQGAPGHAVRTQHHRRRDQPDQRQAVAGNQRLRAARLRSLRSRRDRGGDRRSPDRHAERPPRRHRRSTSPTAGSTNAFNGETIGDKEQYAARAQLAWEPSDRADVSVRLSWGSDESDNQLREHVGSYSAPFSLIRRVPQRSRAGGTRATASTSSAISIRRRIGAPSRTAVSTVTSATRTPGRGVLRSATTSTRSP